MTDRVIIVGAGPVGLVAALALAAEGVPTLVLEADAQPIGDPRGAALHPPSLEILDRLGIMDAMAKIGLVVPHWRVRDRSGATIAEFDLGLLSGETRFPHRFHLGQQKLVPILLGRLRDTGLAEVRFGRRVTAISETDAGVEVRCEDGGTESGSWLIGADGARSIVRKATAIGFEGFTWPERFVVTNLADDLASYGFAWTNYMADPQRWAVVLRLEDEHGEPNWRVTYPVEVEQSDKDVLVPDEVQRRLHDVVPGFRGDFTLRYSGIYRVHQRVAETFRKGRAMLIGDAAHINNPLGGFGLNSGIHDAANLAEKLGRVWRGGDKALLDRFDRQRRTINVSFVQAASIRNKRLVEAHDTDDGKRVHDELRAIAADPARTFAYLLESSMLNSVRQAAKIA